MIETGEIDLTITAGEAVDEVVDDKLNSNGKTKNEIDLTITAGEVVDESIDEESQDVLQTPSTTSIIEPPAKVTFENFDFNKSKSDFAREMNVNYPNLKFTTNLIGPSIEVKNISTGEIHEFMYPSDLERDSSIKAAKDKLERLNLFIEGNNQSDPETSYIYNMTGITPDKKSSMFQEAEGISYGDVSKTIMYASIKKTKKIAEDLFVNNNPYFDDYDVEQLAGLQIDFNNYNEDQINQVKSTIYRKVNNELIKESGTGISQDDFYKIYDTSEFQQQLNSSLNNIANEKIYQLASIKYGTNEARDNYTNFKQGELNSSIPKDAADRLKKLNTLNNLKSKLKVEEKNKNNRSVLRLREAISRVEKELSDESVFDVAGFWKMPADKDDAERKSESIRSGFEEGAFFNSLLKYYQSKSGKESEIVSDKEMMQNFYKDQMFLSQNIYDIGGENTLEFQLDANSFLSVVTRAVSMESSDDYMGTVVGELSNYVANNPKAYNKKTGKVKISYNDFYELGVGVKSLEGFFDEAKGYIDVEELMPYKAWKEEKLETDGVLEGLHSLLYLGVDPKNVEKENLLSIFSRSLVREFATGDIYGGMDLEKAKDFTNYIFGRDPREVITNVQQAVSSYNKANPEKPINFSKEQLENMEETFAESGVSMAGGMVPFLFEMFVIGAATEGVGLTGYLSKLPSIMRIPAMGVLEEGKMSLAPSMPYHAGTGFTFGVTGQLTNLIPVKVFEKNFKLLRPFYEKIVKTGWVGAASAQVSEVGQMFAKDLMDQKDFMTEFDKVYGGLFEGDDESIKEFKKRILLDTFVFGITGASHLKSIDFKSTAAKKAILKDVQRKIMDSYKALDDLDLATLPKDGQPLSQLDPSKALQFYQGIEKNSSVSKKTKEAIRKELQNIEALQSMGGMLMQRINFESTVSDLDPKNPKFKENYEGLILNTVKERLNKRVLKHNNTEGNQKLENPNIEFVVGEGNTFRANNNFNKTQAAKFVQVEPGKYKIILDLNTYSPGKPIHEISHVFYAEQLRLNPESKQNMAKNPLSEVMSNTKVGIKDLNGNDLTGSDIKAEVERLYKGADKSEIEQEFLGGMLELLTDPNFYYDNPNVAGNFIQQLNTSFKNVRKKYGMELPESTSTIRTVEDLVKEIYTIGSETNNGFISQRSLDLIEGLTSGKFNELGDISINQVISESNRVKETLKNSIENVKTELASENIFKAFKLSEKAKELNVTLRQRLTEAETDREKQAIIGEVIENNIPLVNDIAFNDFLYARFNIEGVPRSVKEKVAEDLYYELVHNFTRKNKQGELAYDPNISGIETFIRNNLQPKLLQYLEKNEFFTQKVEVSALGELANDAFESFYSNNNSSDNRPNILDVVPTRVEEYYKSTPEKAEIEVLEINNKLDKTQIGVDGGVTSYATTPDLSTVYKDAGVKENKIKNEDGTYKKGATRLTEKELDSSQDWLFNNLKEIFEILPDGYVPVEEYEVTPGEPVISTDKLGGTSTGVQEVLLRLGIYEKQTVREGDKRGAGIYGFKKIDSEKFDLTLQQKILEEFGLSVNVVDGELVYSPEKNLQMADNTNLNSRYQSIIYQTGKSLTNNVIDQYVVKEVKDAGLLNDLRAGKSRTRASENISEALLEEFKLSNDDKGKNQLIAILDDVELNKRKSKYFDRFRSIVLSEVKREKDGKGFKALVSKKYKFQRPAFKTVEDGVVNLDVDAQIKHIKVAEDIIKLIPVDALTSNSKGGDPGSFLETMFKLGSNRIAGNTGSVQGVSFRKSLSKVKKKISEIKDKELRSAWEKFAETSEFFEPANSGKMAKFNIGIIKSIAEGKNKVTFIGNDGKKYTFDPEKGNTKEDKIKFIDKAFDPNVIKSLKRYDYAFNLTLQKWYNSEKAKGSKEEKAAKNFLYDHFAMTSQSVLSDRAFAGFSSLLLLDGKQEFNKLKGEHIDDSSTNSFKKFDAIIQGNYNLAFHELLSSTYFQSLTEKAQLDIIDKVKGVNTQDPRKMLVGIEGPIDLRNPMSPVPAENIYNFVEKQNMSDIFYGEASQRARQELLKQNELKVQNSNQTVKDVVSNPKVASEVVSAKNELITMASKGIKEIMLKPEEIASVFDLDDNLIFTKTKVRYELPNGDKGELDAAEFNRDKEFLETKGAKFDYSDFNKVIKESYGPAWDLFKKEYARSPEDAYILTARASGSKEAIQGWLLSEGYKVDIKNIITTEGTEFLEGDLKGENKKAYEILGFYTGRYNGKRYKKINYTDDYLPNVEGIKYVTDQLDITGSIYQTLASNNIKEAFDKNLSEMTGVAEGDLVSYSVAVNRGSAADKKKQLVPYSAEDFTGLLYATLGRGAKGEQQWKFYKENLIDPYSKGKMAVDADKVNMMKDFKTLKKGLSTSESLNQESVLGFTKQDAVRVYLWNKQGLEVPGLSNTDIARLNNYVVNNSELSIFAESILKVTKGDGYSTPKQDWLAGTISTDLLDLSNGTKRQKYLHQFLENKDIIFSEENKNKLRAKFGNKYMESLENSLLRMEKGTNRIFSGNRLGNQALDYINNSVGATMFLNSRSAVLQTISSANFINWGYNNPYLASKAFANQPQFWSDFLKIVNHPTLVERRGGLRMGVNESELVEAGKKSNSIMGALSLVLQKGQISKYFDAGAIGLGGSTHYRNRIIDLMSAEKQKENPMTLEQAEARAMFETLQIVEINQQSGDPSKISSQQASDVGRLLLSFANTPMQYVRIQKRAVQDLVNRRGDDKENISKIIYYGFVQNLVFNSLQQALFASDESDIDERTANTINGMIDSQLRGMGIGGNTAMMVKNVIQDIYKRSDRKRPEYIDAIWKVLSVSPSVNSKVSKLKQAAYAFDSKKKREQMSDISLDNPLIEALTNVTEATTNAPVNRLYDKLQNVRGALQEETEWWQSIAMLLGWPEWQLQNIDKDDNAFKSTINQTNIGVSNKNEKGGYKSTGVSGGSKDKVTIGAN